MLIGLAAGLQYFKIALLFCFLVYAFLAVQKKRILPYGNYIPIAIVIHLLFAVLFTILQYFLWKGSSVSLVFLQSPLPPETPLGAFNLARGLFDGNHGYFAYYSIMHFFLRYVALGMLSIGIALVMEAWVRMKGSSVTRKDALVVMFCALALSWPNALLLLPFTLILLVIYSCFEAAGLFKKSMTLEQAALIVALFVFLFGKIILEQFNLYTLLVL